VRHQIGEADLLIRKIVERGAVVLPEPGQLLAGAGPVGQDLQKVAIQPLKFLGHRVD
jgi:hypothetical protein